ncbi:chloride channel protein [Corynebacterium mastitidis]|uniref:Chloride channel protein n=1 Tax=Corynebacterium mastitidis TaxID=161890 RepID=A0ABU8P1I2_9CORY
MRNRVLSISLFYGALAGFLAALTLQLMLGLQHAIWRFDSGPFFTFVVVFCGGVVLALLQRLGETGNLDDSLALAGEASPANRKKISLLAASAIVAVACGASIGPEAGLVAVVAELAAVVGAKIARTERERRALGEAGNAAALAGFYGSPLGGAWYEEEAEGPSRTMALLAALSGFLAFLGALKIVGAQPHGLDIPVAQRGDISTWWEAVPAAMLGCAVALLFHALHGWLHGLRAWFSARFPAAWAPTMVGSVALAALLAAMPILRFSGHEELGEIPELIDHSAWGFLAAIVLLKCLATALSVVSGWPGGEFFPLVFAGAAAGAVSMAVFPGVEAGTAMAAGMAAAAIVALHKPVAVVFIMVFMLDGTAMGPLVVAALLAMVTLALLPKKEDHVR